MQPDYCHVLLFIVHGLSAYYILVIEDTKSNEIHNGVQMCLILVYYLVASCILLIFKKGFKSYMSPEVFLLFGLARTQTWSLFPYYYNLYI